MSEGKEITNPVARTSVGLRNALFDELDGLRNGSSNANRANAVAKIAAQVLETVRLEIDMQRYMTKVPPSAGVSTDGNRSLPHIVLGE